MLLSAYIFLSVCGISLNRVIDKALFYREDEDLTSLIEEFYDTSCYMYVHMYFLEWWQQSQLFALRYVEQWALPSIVHMHYMLLIE